MTNSNTLFHFKERTIRRYLTNTANAIGSITLTDDYPLGYAFTYDSIDDIPAHSKIGINGLSVKTNPFYITKYIPDKNFITCITAMFHESRHITNANNRYNLHNEKLSNTLLFNYIAQHGMGQYYLYNYANMQTEIDAEHTGILNAYDHVTNSFPDIDKHKIENLFIDYVNCRMSTSNYMIKNLDHPLKTIEDIDVAFSTAFDNARTYPRARKISDLKNSPGQNNSVLTTLNTPKWRQIRNKIDDETDNCKKDMMLTSVVLYLRPRYRIYLDQLKQFDLSPQTLFNCDFPSKELSRQEQYIASLKSNPSDDIQFT